PRRPKPQGRIAVSRHDVSMLPESIPFASANLPAPGIARNRGIPGADPVGRRNSDGKTKQVPVDTPRRTPPAGGCHGLSSTRACKATAAAHWLKTARGTLNCTHPVFLTLFVSRIGGDQREVSKKYGRGTPPLDPACGGAGVLARRHRAGNPTTDLSKTSQD